MTVIRDYDCDAILDFYNGTKERGNFGINIHRAESFGDTKFINKYSAGCQVFQNSEDFAQFKKLCEKHKALYGNRFTYTLVDLRALNRVTLKRVITATTIAAGLVWRFHGG